MSFIQSYTYNPATEKVVPKDAVVIRNWTPGVGEHRDSLLALLRSNYWLELADQIERETAEPRIPEPGLWGVVEAGASATVARTEWVHTRRGWRELDTGTGSEWKHLVDPVLIRPGTGDAS